MYSSGGVVVLCVYSSGGVVVACVYSSGGVVVACVYSSDGVVCIVVLVSCVYSSGDVLVSCVYSKSGASSKEDRRRLLSLSPTQQVDTPSFINAGFVRPSVCLSMRPSICLFAVCLCLVIVLLFHL